MPHHVWAAGTGDLRLAGEPMEIAELAALLQGCSDRPVIDRTGLAGMFEILVEVPQPEDRAGWFDAMRAMVDPLGLKLQSE